MTHHCNKSPLTIFPFKKCQIKDPYQVSSNFTEKYGLGPRGEFVTTKCNYNPKPPLVINTTPTLPLSEGHILSENYISAYTPFYLIKRHYCYFIIWWIHQNFKNLNISTLVLYACTAPGCWLFSLGKKGSLTLFLHHILVMCSIA